MFRLRIARRDRRSQSSAFCDCGWQKLRLRNQQGEVIGCPRCEPRLRAYGENLLMRSNIPERCHKGLKALDRDEDNSALLDDCIAALKKPELLNSGSWFLHGSTGSGKTQVAGAFGVELIRRWLRPVKYIHFGDYLNRIRYNLGREEELKRELSDMLDIEPEFASTHRRLRQVRADINEAYAIELTPVLIVDDLIRNYRAGYETERLYDITQYREQKRLFTITTAHDKNLPGMPERVSSRILQMSHHYYTGAVNRRQITV